MWIEKVSISLILIYTWFSQEHTHNHFKVCLYFIHSTFIPHFAINSIPCFVSNFNYPISIAYFIQQNQNTLMMTWGGLKLLSVSKASKQSV